MPRRAVRDGLEKGLASFAAIMAVAGACFIVAELFAVCVHAQDTMKVAQESPGFRPTMTNLGDGESVAPYNGGLTVVHPSAFLFPQNMGGSVRLLRVYNSKFMEDAYDSDGFFATPVDSPTGVLGLGWTLSLGRVLARTMRHEVYDCDPLHPTYEARVFYFYQGEDGGEHKLYRDSGMENWGNASTEPSTSWYFTNDGSYIRAKYDISLHQWTIYFPNGSKSIAGGEEGKSFLRPIIQGYMVVNPYTNGWYVTRIEDRAGNFTTITYRAYDAANQPYAGAISTIQDQFQRPITFTYDGGTHLLSQITCNGHSESFEFAPVSWTPPGKTTAESFPALSKAVNPAGQETLYRYAAYTRQDGVVRSCLTQIFYPTGAVSEYDYQPYLYRIAQDWMNPDQINFVTRNGIAVHSHTIRSGHAALGGASARDVRVWTWDRSHFPGRSTYWLSEFGIADKVQPILVTDPLGTQEASYFVADSLDSPSMPPGTEVLSVRRLPGAPVFDPSGPLLYAASSVKTDSESGDAPVGTAQQPDWQGDSHRCIEDWVTAPRMVPYGNLRVFRKTETKYGDTPAPGPFGGQANPPTKWQEVTESFAWDGFGHYQATQVTGLPSPGNAKITGLSYQLKTDINTTPIVYQLDRLETAFTGAGQLYYTPATPPAYQEPGGPASCTVSGDFRATHSSYDGATGLVVEQRSFSTLVHSWGLCWDIGFCAGSRELSPPANSAGDKVLALTYDDKGNISKLLYSGCDSAATYGFNFEWDHGMVSRMWRDGLSYNDFTRVIDPETSLITSHTDSNNLTTSFEYDTLNRLTKIIPPGGEYSTHVYYPNDATTYDGSTWATGHDILFYVGPEGFTPDVNDSLSGMDSGAAYAHYIFDDLGRLVKTRSLHPDGQLYDAVTAYDPLGAAFFTSLPYRADMGTPLSLDWSSKFPSGSGNVFVMGLPSKDGIHPYGGVTSIFAGAAWTNNVQDLIAGSPEPFYRPLWSFKPTGDRTGTAYDGLSSTVTLYGIQTGLNATSNSATTYTKDVFGRLLHVQPPMGSPADYTYDAFGHVIQANLSGQVRTWTYNALGRLLSASNPENGTTNFLQYDCIGNLLLSQDANGAAAAVPYKLASTYDAAGRLLATNKVSAADGTTLLQSLISNTYDASTLALPDGNQVSTGASLGKLVQAVSYQDTNGTAGVPSSEWFQYDTATGRVVYDGQATQAGGGYEENGLTFAYDQYGQVTGETLPGMGAVLANVYSHGAVVQRQMDGSPVLSALKYDAAGAMTEIDFATGEVEKIALDQYGRPIGFNFSDPGNVQRWGNGYYANPAGPDHGLDYVYDDAGNITSISSAQGVTDNFTYDLLSRLTNATINRAGYAHAYSYGYDAYGNLLGRTEALQNGAANLKASIMNTAGYRVPGQAPDETAATNYIREVAFTAQLASGANGVTNNRLSSVTRGGVVMGVDTGLAQQPASMVYDANGNLIDDGKYLYGYDALNRQVSVTDKLSNLLIAEYAYLASGERIAAMKYAGGGVSDYTRYVREGSAVVWEKTDSTGHEKRYVYAGGRMAYTKEAWMECTLPKTLSLQTAQLATTSVAADANGTTTTATIALPGLPQEANAVEVRLVKGNSLIASQHIDRPEGGQWCGYEQAVFAGLVEGNDYQAGITLFFREGRAKVMPLKAYLIERMKLGIVKGKLAAWAVKRLKADNESVSEETTTGFAGLAPDGAEDYTAMAAQGAQMQEVAQGRQVDEAQVPQGTASVSVQGSAGTSVSLAAPSLGSATLNGSIILPQCSRHALNTYYATDHLGTVRFTKTVDDNGIVTTTTHDYEPFGVEITPADACDNTHKFTGHERDAETGNDYMHFRFYGASMGRFQKPDSNFDNPIANPQGWNLYSYVNGNPVNFNDPTGHLCFTGGNVVFGAGRAQFEGYDPYGDGGGGGGGGGDPPPPDTSQGAQPAAGATVAPGTTNNQAQQQAQTPQPAQAGGQPATPGTNTAPAQQQPAVPENEKPSKMVIVGMQPGNDSDHHNYYVYQLQNGNGDALTSSNYTVAEHMTYDNPRPGDTQNNTNDKYFSTHEGKGYIYDKVGFDRDPGDKESYISVSYQSFSVKYKDYPPVVLSTVFKHEEKWDKNGWSATVTVATP